MNNNDPNYFTCITLSNTRSALLHKILTGINELMGLESITRKAIASVPKYDMLGADI